MKSSFIKKACIIVAAALLATMSFSVNAQIYVGGALESGKLASAIAVDASGNVYVMQYNSASGNPNAGGTGEVVKYAANNLGGAPTVIATGIPDDDNASNDYATGIVVDPINGDVFVESDNQDFNNIAPYGIIYKLKNNGDGTYTKSGWIIGNPSIGYPSAIAMDASGNLYVDEYNGGQNYYQIDQYNRGSSSISATLYTGLDQSQLVHSENSIYFYAAPSGLAVNSSGTVIYVTEDFEDDGGYDDQGYIDKLTKSGSTWSLSHVSNGFSATGLALDASGNLYATQTTLAVTRIGVTSSNDYNPHYGLYEYPGGNATQSPVGIYSPLNAATVNLFPFGIAIVNDNDIFVTDGQASNGSNAVYQVIGQASTQASQVAFSHITPVVATISWTNGNGSNRAVFMERGNSGQPTVTNGTNYTANAAWASGSTAGSGWYCMYNGTGNSVNIDGLVPSNTYKVQVVEYNGSSTLANENYTTSAATNNPNFLTTATPTISASGSPSALSTNVGTVSSSTSFSVSGSNLLTNVTASVPFGFDISLDNSNWSSSGGSQTIIQNNGNISSQTVYIRLDAGDAAGAYSGNVSLTSISANAVDVAIPTSSVLAPTTISSLTAVNSTITNAASVQYTATFATSVTGLSASDFSLSTSGVSGAGVSNVTGSGASWTITVNTGSGSGTIQLAMNSASGLSPSVSNLPFSGATYAIDKTPPTAAISAPSAAVIGSGGTGTVTYTVTYADANFNTSSLGNSAITLNATGTAAGTVNVTGAGASYTVTISGITGFGTLGISVAAGHATDLAGNADAGAGPSATFNVVSTDATLSNLVMNVGKVSPAFSPGTLSYTRSVVFGVSAVTVTPTSTDPNATILVNGTVVTSGTASSPISLNVGPNNIAVKVTAEDGTTTQTYGITVTRGPSSNDNLSALVLNPGVKSPAFTSGNTSYTASVANAVTSTIVTPTTGDPNATVTVDGTAVASGTPSGPVPLSIGQNTINVTVTAQDGVTAQTYTVIVTRTPSTNANLSALHLSTGGLSPSFLPATTSYTSKVANATASITITPTTSDAGATVKINGTSVTSGTPSAPISLSTGADTITVVVTAQDGITQKTYTVIETRALSNNANLATLGQSINGLTPSFTSGNTSYTINAASSITSMTLKPVSSEAHATITVNGTTVASGTKTSPITLAIGPNTITTKVTAQDGSTTKTYTLTVTRASAGTNSFNSGISVTMPTAIGIADDGIQVHQGVSPNGDGINDFLQIDNISQYPNNKLAIMNRNGQLVYEANGYDNSSKVFDGHSNKNGQLQLPGTYFYQLDYTVSGITKHKTGFIVLKY